MLGERLDGLVDVGIIVIAHFENPAAGHAREFLKKVFLSKIKAGIPLTTFLGAYHIMTKYLRLDPILVSRSLKRTLSLNSPIFIEDILKLDVIRSLEFASYFEIESWDAYLLSLAERYGAKVIFSIDEELKKKIGKNLLVVNPIPEDVMERYQDFIKKPRSS